MVVEGWGRSSGCRDELRFGLKMLVKMVMKSNLYTRLPF